MSKWRKILITILVIVSVVLLAERPVKNYFLNKANANVVNQVKETSNKELEENNKKDASYDFDSVKSIN